MEELPGMRTWCHYHVCAQHSSSKERDRLAQRGGTDDHNNSRNDNHCSNLASAIDDTIFGGNRNG